MEKQIVLTPRLIEEFCTELHRRERAPGTVEQYRRCLNRLRRALPGPGRMDRESLLAWKGEIVSQRAPSTVNCMIAAVNAMLEYTNAVHLKLKGLRCQRRTFSEEELSREEFQALVERACQTGDEQTAALLRAMTGSGIRVSEVRFLTVEAAREKMAVIRLKGKTRFVPLGDKVCAGLLAFAKEQNIHTGPIFCGKNGKPLDRRRIWERMKRLCEGAGVDPDKVHPHALRHLFARIFYDITHDLAKLADLLGHGSIETTRIYIMTSCSEHRSILDLLTTKLNEKNRPHRDGRKRWRT